MPSNTPVSNEPWYWTGSEETSECGCVYRELAATDGYCEPIWMGKPPMCAEHRERVTRLATEMGLA